MIASLPGQQLSNNNILTYTWKNCLEPRGKLKLERFLPIPSPFAQTKTTSIPRILARETCVETVYYTRPSVQDENRFIVGQFQTRNYP